MNTARLEWISNVLAEIETADEDPATELVSLADWYQELQTEIATIEATLKRVRSRAMHVMTSNELTVFQAPNGVLEVVGPSTRVTWQRQPLDNWCLKNPDIAHEILPFRSEASIAPYIKLTVPKS